MARETIKVTVTGLPVKRVRNVVHCWTDSSRVFARENHVDVYIKQDTATWQARGLAKSLRSKGGEVVAIG